MNPVTIYLAGAIRDNHLGEDAGWRQQVIEGLSGVPGVALINPLGAKMFYEREQKWQVAGIPALSGVIVPQDAWAVDHSDIVLANLESLAEGYPSIGTLMEIGRAWGAGKLIYAIIPPSYRGHGNEGMFRLHPFLERIVAGQFVGVQQAVRYLQNYLPVLTGSNPSFRGVV